jgi:hypothetical protein
MPDNNCEKDVKKFLATMLMKVENKSYDLSRIPGNGAFIFPLSMCRLHAGQDPKSLYDMICFLDGKLEEKSADFIATTIYRRNVTPPLHKTHATL